MFDCLVTMRSKLITEVKKDDIEANYSGLKSNLALLFFFFSLPFSNYGPLWVVSKYPGESP